MSITLTIAPPPQIPDYDTLKDVVALWLNRSDLIERVPVFIENAERRFNRLLYIPQTETTATGDIEADATMFELPADFRAMRAARIGIDRYTPPLRAVSLEEFNSDDLLRLPGYPTTYAVTGNQMLLGPIADVDYVLTYTYYTKIPFLNSDTGTNWLLDEHADVYLYGALLQAEAFLANDERVPLWKSALDEALGEIMDAGAKRRYSGSPLTMRAQVRQYGSARI